MAENTNTDIIEGQVINANNNDEKNNKAFLALSLIDVIMLVLGITLLIW